MLLFFVVSHLLGEKCTLLENVSALVGRLTILYNRTYHVIVTSVLAASVDIRTTTTKQMQREEARRDDYVLYATGSVSRPKFGCELRLDAEEKVTNGKRLTASVGIVSRKGCSRKHMATGRQRSQRDLPCEAVVR